MRKGSVSRWVVLGLTTLFAWGAAAQAKSESPKVLLRWDAWGEQKIRAAEGLTLAEIFALPETDQLRAAARTNFAYQAAARFARNDTNQQQQLASLIRPVLMDIAASPSKFEMVAGEAGNAQWMLAVKLTEDQANLWDKNLAQLAAAAGLQKGENGKVHGSPGWTAKSASYSLSFYSAKGWTLVQGGAPGNPGQDAFTSFRSKLDAGGDHLLTVRADLAGLGKLWNLASLEQGPVVDLKVVPRKPGVRSEMLIEYPHDLGIKPEPWKIPENTILDPLILGQPSLVGFTAIQGIHHWLGKNPAFQSLGAQKTPNQFFLWSHATSPFSLFWAAEVGNPSQVISNTATRLLPQLKAKTSKVTIGEFEYSTNQHSLLWRGLPILIPHLKPAADAGFVAGGLFPLSNTSTNKPPAELLSQLKTRNLVFYDWEVTQARMAQWRPVWQLNYMLGQKVIPLGSALSEKWMDAIAPKLGNTITQVTLENPRRLKMVRQSPVGLSALELVLFAHWLDPKDLASPRDLPRGEKVAPLPLPKDGKLPEGKAPAKPPSSPDAETRR